MMKRIKSEKTKAEGITAEDYLRTSLRAVERMLQRPKYINPEWDSEEQGIRDCLGWTRGTLMMALDLRECEKIEPEKDKTTEEEYLRASVQAIDIIMQKLEYCNAKFGTEEHGFRECLGWMRAIFKIALELMEAEKEEKEKGKERQEVREDE